MFGWVTKLVLVLSVVGVLGLDALACASARVGAKDSAESAGRAAVSSWQQARHLQRAYDAALAQVAASGDTIETTSFTATPDGAVTLTLHRSASTLVLHRVSRLRHLADVTATVVTRPAP